MASRMCLVLIFSCVHLISQSSEQGTGFVYNGFDQAQADLYIDGTARILSNGLLQLTSTSSFQMGHAFFKLPFDFDPAESISFYTHFVCALVPLNLETDGGHGTAFVVSSSMDLSHASTAEYLGLFSNPVNETSSSSSFSSTSTSHLLAIELDTVETLDFDELKESHVGIDVNSPRSVESAKPTYFSNGKNESIKLLSGEPIQVWVDYDGSFLNVSLAPWTSQTPSGSSS